MIIFFIILSLLQVLYVSADPICVSIDTPGTYQFSDIESSPTDVDDAIICVHVSDVTIDLGGSILSQASDNFVAGFDGIRIDSGLSDITIKNGVIRNLTGIGVAVGEGCNNVIIQNLLVEHCNETGILFAGTVSDEIINGSIDHCLVFSCTGADGNPAYGIRLIQSKNIEINDCDVQQNDADVTNSGFGISLEWCTACKVSNCYAHENGGNVLGVGINISQSSWSTVQNCNAINTVARSNSASSKAVGFLINQSEYTSVLYGLSKHNTNFLAQAIGFESTGGTGNCFQNCTAINNIGATIGAGFALRTTENNSAIIKSKSRSNDGGLTGIGYGILLDGAELCDIGGNQLVANTGQDGYGLVDTTTDTTNLIYSNIAFGNTTQGYDVIRTSGTFPLVEASVSDFSPTFTVNKYVNIDFSV